MGCVSLPLCGYLIILEIVVKRVYLKGSRLVWLTAGEEKNKLNFPSRISFARHSSQRLPITLISQTNVHVAAVRKKR